MGDAQGWESSHGGPGRGQALAGGDGLKGRSLLPRPDGKGVAALAAERRHPDIPVRVQRRRTAGWRMPEGAIYVGRPGRWGNPFRLGTYTALARVPGALSDAPWEYEGRVSGHGTRHDYFHPDGRVTRCEVRYMTPAEVVATYRRLLLGDLTPSMQAAGLRTRSTLGYDADDVRRELRGRDLVCWCPPWQACHADVLIEVANDLPF